YCMESGFKTIQTRFAEILGNLPNRFVAYALKFMIQPLGAPVHGPSDELVHQCAQVILEPSAARDRLTPNLYRSNDSNDDNPVARLEKAFELVTAAEGATKKMHAAHLSDWREAVKKGVITASDGDRLEAAQAAVARVVEVDDFAREVLSPIYKHHPLSQTQQDMQAISASSKSSSSRVAS